MKCRRLDRGSNWARTFKELKKKEKNLKGHLDLKGLNRVGPEFRNFSHKIEGHDRPTLWFTLRSARIAAMSHHHNLSQEGESGRATEGALTAGQRRRRWGRRMERFGLPHIGDKWAHKRKRVFQGPRTHYATGKGSRGEGRMATFGDGLFRLLFGPHGPTTPK